MNRSQAKRHGDCPGASALARRSLSVIKMEHAKALHEAEFDAVPMGTASRGFILNLVASRHVSTNHPEAGVLRAIHTSLFEKEMRI